ncbi:DUF4365 domain-containing protein [Oenococcus sicerae]|uniref:DUF4365 domain-containing protein n=1 Tax=Oenococcus sicerae TaxID=2203724 RepID=A0ABX5QKN6_9LACO|nr:DUF4365 domain-containing protein [Oenococcus sicerae]
MKTFFKQNDRTPDYDGTFELFTPDRKSSKQFIVQIKKTSNLKPGEQGKNRDKYLYDLETNFLYYAKERVNESPAIYFVVNIVMNKVFWLYLSDDKLMELNFEGKGKVRYVFSQNEILSETPGNLITCKTISGRNRSSSCMIFSISKAPGFEYMQRPCKKHSHDLTHSHAQNVNQVCSYTKFRH